MYKFYSNIQNLKLKDEVHDLTSELLLLDIELQAISSGGYHTQLNKHTTN